MTGPTGPPPRWAVRGGLLTALRHGFHTAVFALYPVIVVVAANIEADALNDPALIRAALILVFTAVVVVAAISRLRGGMPAATLWTSVVLILFELYGPLGSIFIGPDQARAESSRPLALGYALVAMAVSTAFVQPWRLGSRRVLVLNTVAFVLLLQNLWPIARGIDWTTSPRWSHVADQIARAPGATYDVTPERDVYYFVLDALGRSDVLRDEYALDVGPFVASLQRRGFDVALNARTNYPHTYLSLSSTLNLSYLDSLAAVMGGSTRDPRPLKYLIDHNALMRLAKETGYRVLAVGSDYSVTRSMPAAQECACDGFGVGEYDMAIAINRPYAPFITPWAHASHRLKIRSEFAAIREFIERPSPKFVFAHVAAPHPPFVFGAGGESANPPFRFTFADASDYPGTPQQYRLGYRAQASYVLAELGAIIEVLHTRPGPPPIVVIQGDHGPGAEMDLESAARTDMNERMSIFLAASIPGSPQTLYPSITPVNVARVVANRAFGATLPRLADRSIFARSSHLYEQTPVIFSGAVGESRKLQDRDINNR